LELEPIIAALVEQAGWHGVAQEDLQVSPADMQLGKSASHWVVVSHERVTVSFLQAQTSWHELKLDRPRRVWTDQYSSLWEAVRWKKL
jgi:hypothetical protein